MEAKRQHIYFLVDSIDVGQSHTLYVESRVFDEFGDMAAVISVIIDREDAEKLARNIDKWLDRTAKK